MRPGGIVKLRLPRNWSPSSRSSFRVKELKAPASGFEVPATRLGLKGRTWPGHWAAVGARSRGRRLGRVPGRPGRVPGEEVGVDGVDRAGVGVAIRPRSEAKRWSWKSSKGTCGRSSK